MSTAEVVAYVTFVTAGLTIAYVILLSIEVRKGTRIGKTFRQYLDRKTTALAKKMGRNVRVINDIYEKGSDEVEKDLIDPVTKPILQTQHKYTALKTGEGKIRRAGLSKTSPHLQALLKRNKRASKNQAARFRKRLKELQREVQREKNAE